MLPERLAILAGSMHTHHDQPSRVALSASLLLHALLIAPVWGWLIQPTPAAPPAAEESAPIEFTFVEPRDAPGEEPDAPTPLLSTQNQRAAQVEDSADRPQGAAFQVGETRLPTAPRPSGAEAATPAPPEREVRRATDDALREPSDESAPRAARDDARLARPENPLNLPPQRRVLPGSGSRLPAPEVDQRLTSARAGSTFSLNTMEWEWGPYMARLKARVERQIFPPPAFYYGTAAWATRVRFRIAPDGRLERLELLDHRGVANLQYVATSAIEGAADYEPLPPGFPEEFLEITGNFYFNVAPPAR